MKAQILLLSLTLLASPLMATSHSSTAPLPPKSPPPLAAQLVQWNLNSVEHLIIFRFINPMQADLHLKVYGPQGYLVHVEDLSSGSRNKIGFSLRGMASGTYRVTLESDGLLLSDETVDLY